MNRPLARLAGAAILVYALAIALHPLDANDLFWHLATGREILASGQIPTADPFSFASEGQRWVDHEWLWQVVAQGVYGLAAGGRGPAPDAAAGYALIVCGALVVLVAFGLAVARLIRSSLPAAGIAALGLLAAEIARERLMVRPETASVLFLAILLYLLASGRPGLLRAIVIAALTGIWANVHPAALLSPVVVLLHGLGGTGSASDGTADPSAGAGRAAGSAVRRWSRRSYPIIGETLFAALGTLVNPYGIALWGVPLQLAALVRTEAFFNPEWLAPPLGRFPQFWAGAVIVAAAAGIAAVRARRIPSGPLLVALALALIAARQMRHMALFATAVLFAGPDLFGALVPVGRARGLLGKRAVAAAATLLAFLAAPLALVSIWSEPADPGAGSAGRTLDPGRFPVAACEAVARNAPGLRLYNDVGIGGYLIWRFFPPSQVFIDGRNEIYPRLLARLGRIHTEDAYADWRLLIGEYGIGGAIVKYKEGRKGVLYPPERPGDPPVAGYRAWSAYLFPAPEWALVYFDDTAMVFMKRDGPGQPWIARGEFRNYNPEDGEYLLERAAGDREIARLLRNEAARRVDDQALPRSLRAERFLVELRGVMGDAPGGSEARSAR